VAALLAAGCHLTLGLEEKVFGATGAGGSDTGGGGAGGTGGASGGGGAGGGPTCNPAIDCSCDFGGDLDDELDGMAFDEDPWPWHTSGFTPGPQPEGTFEAFADEFHYLIKPGTMADLWFREDDAPLRYREICGDFGVYTRLTVAVPPSSTSPPTLAHNGGGLVVRNGDANTNELVLFSLAANDMGDLVTYVWTTTNDESVEESSSGPEATNEWVLGLCRVDGEIRYYRKEPLDTVAAENVVPLKMPPNLPQAATLDVGITAHRASVQEELGAQFRFVRYFRPAGGSSDERFAGCRAVMGAAM
jgi:hypothetical protein